MHLTRPTLPRATSPLATSQLDVHIIDLVADQTLTHRFENRTDEPLEIVYSFPLPLDAAFLGFSATLAGHTLHARVQARAAATRRYDDAIADGHSAALLTTPEPGVVCASLGNLLPGERGEIRLRFATALRVAGGTARYSLPLVHRPRYGRWRLEELETPQADLAAEHPLTARITVTGLLAQADARCSSHDATWHRAAASQRIDVPGAALDRDLALTFPLDRPLAPTAHLIRDDDANLAVVAMVLPGRGTPPPPLDVCLLLDGSGSMAGDAIVQSRRALAAVADALGADDRLQVIRFGSETAALFRRPLRLTAAVRAAVHELAAVIDADLGGTEMSAALRAGTASFQGASPHGSRAIILVTDGAVQPGDIAEAGEDAQALGIRVFVVAVGSAAGTEVLAPLATATGAMLERALPGEPIDLCVARQLARARETRPQAIDVRWPDAAARTLPADPAYPGDAVTLSALLPAGCTGTVRVALPDRPGTTVTIELPAAIDAPAQRALAGLRRYAAAPTREREALALRYGLLTAETAAVLVHERPAAGRPASLPRIVAVAPMVPDGMIGVGGLHGQVAADASPAGFGLASSASASWSFLDMPAFLRRSTTPDDTLDDVAPPRQRPAPPAQPPRVVLQALLDALRQQLAGGELQLDAAIEQAAHRAPAADVRVWVDALGFTADDDHAVAALLLLALQGALDQPALTDDEEAGIALNLRGTPTNGAAAAAALIRKGLGR